MATWGKHNQANASGKTSHDKDAAAGGVLGGKLGAKTVAAKAAGAAGAGHAASWITAGVVTLLVAGSCVVLAATGSLPSFSGANDWDSGQFGSADRGFASQAYQIQETENSDNHLQENTGEDTNALSAQELTALGDSAVAAGGQLANATASNTATTVIGTGGSAEGGSASEGTGPGGTNDDGSGTSSDNTNNDDDKNPIGPEQPSTGDPVLNNPDRELTDDTPPSAPGASVSLYDYRSLSFTYPLDAAGNAIYPVYAYNETPTLDDMRGAVFSVAKYTDPNSSEEQTTDPLNSNDQTMETLFFGDQNNGKENPATYTIGVAPAIGDSDTGLCELPVRVWRTYTSGVSPIGKLIVRTVDYRVVVCAADGSEILNVPTNEKTIDLSAAMKIQFEKLMEENPDAYIDPNTGFLKRMLVAGWTDGSSTSLASYTFNQHGSTTLYAVAENNESASVPVPAGFLLKNIDGQQVLVGVTQEALSSEGTVKVPEGITRIALDPQYVNISGASALELPSTLVSLDGASINRTIPTLSNVSIVNDSNTVFSSKSGALYSADGKTLIYAPAAISSLDVLASVESIDGAVFEGRATGITLNLSSVEPPSLPDSISSNDRINLSSSLEDVGYRRYLCSYGQKVNDGDVILEMNGTTLSYSDYSYVDGLVYADSGKVLSFVPSDRIGEFDLPMGVSSIQANAFTDAAGIETLKLGGALTALPSNALSGLASVASIIVEKPESITSIDVDVFGLSAASSVKVYLTGVSKDSLSYKVWLAALRSVFPINAESHIACVSNKLYTNPIDGSVYEDHGNSTYTLLSVPSSATRFSPLDGTIAVANKAFANCANIVNIQLPSTVASVGDGAFEGCTSLEVLLVPAQVYDGIIS